MTSNEIRNKFLDFFKSKQHEIVASAPMVIKNDPTLMFTNAGMNQFKEIFLGQVSKKFLRIADSQKCLRVSGKHNDLEEVGHDTYHHTMFEMLGNWSFGDYFKKQAIDWAWELLVGEFKISPDRLYASVFEGDSKDKLEFDKEAYDLWRQYLDGSHIINGSKKDNFWEMGDAGPCGPCSEVHIDLRSDAEREKIDGAELVNKDHPEVIEIWNLVFIQFNRKANGSLENLPEKHVDTGMGFERLCMVVQGKKSNYDIDVFQTIIADIERITGFRYGKNREQEIAMRVIADHLRTIAFSIADGQLPSNNKAGYVIRRILRRAVRYAYTFLNQSKPFMYRLLPALIKAMGEAYPELEQQNHIIEKVIQEEEISFLRTLSTGIRLLDQIIEKTKQADYQIVDGKLVFELYDTYGFPLDLTELILKEHNLIVNKREFDEKMSAQKERSRSAAVVETDDWVVLMPEDEVEEFVGYDYEQVVVKIARYRKVNVKGKDIYHLVLNFTPFYAESGGQAGDTGYLEADGEKTNIFDTQKEHGLILHFIEKLPQNLGADFKAVVSHNKRVLTSCNHSATHLLHNELRRILGEHVEQKGSLVNEKHLRFDFSHFQKLSDEEITAVEKAVNHKIRSNIPLDEHRQMPINEAQAMGAMALFGEKYGDTVRVIKFGDSVELCGGTHVKATGVIGFFKIVSETAIAAGIRRIEAISSIESERFIHRQLDSVKAIKNMLKTSQKVEKAVENLLEENAKLNRQLKSFVKERTLLLKQELKNKIVETNGVKLLAHRIKADNSASVKEIAFQLKGELENIAFVLGAEIKGKPNLTIMFSDNLLKNSKLNAGTIIRQVAKNIQGGGGGQPFYATAGGKNLAGLQAAIDEAVGLIKTELGI